MLMVSDVLSCNHPHFSLGEMIFSSTGALMGISNVPTWQVVRNLDYMASLLETIRQMAGVPLVVTSGYRNSRINDIVHGSATSLHLEGRAVDFIPQCFTFEQKQKLFEDMYEHIPWLTECRLYKTKGHFHVAYDTTNMISKKPFKII